MQKNRALEDIDFNNAEFDEHSDITIYCAYENEDEQYFEGAEYCIACGAVIPEGRQVCAICENKFSNSTKSKFI